MRAAFFLEALRNECPEGSCELLRGLMIGGVLKRLQIMSEPKTGVIVGFIFFAWICPRNLHIAIKRVEDTCILVIVDVPADVYHLTQNLHSESQSYTHE